MAFITDAPRVAGSEVWLLDVLPRLMKHGIQATIYLPPHTTLHELAQRFTAAGVPVERYADLSTLPDRTTDADLRVLQGWNPATYQSLLPRLAEPRLVVAHDQLEYHYPLGLNLLYRAIYRQTKSKPLRQATQVVTVSRWGTAFMRGALGMPDVVGVQNGVDAAKFSPADALERQQLRSEFDFRRFTVLVPGRFTLEKNQLSAVLAARHAPELDFVFVGDMDSALGQVAVQLKKAFRLNNVRFLGRRWDMPQLYRAADALLQPTLAENQSLVTLEAMGAGLPVVTTSISAQAELVQDGVSGLLIKPHPELLGRALKALATNPARTQELGRAARAYALEHHTLEHTASQVAQVIRLCARGTKGSLT